MIEEFNKKMMSQTGNKKGKVVIMDIYFLIGEDVRVESEWW